MPIFEYRCAACGTKYEKIVFKRDGPPPACPQCGSQRSEKLISAPGAVGAARTSGRMASECPAAATGQCPSGFT